MRVLVFVVAVVVAVTSSAAQASQRFEVVQGSTSWQFAYAWPHGDGAHRRVAFSLPADAILEDSVEPTALPKQELYAHAAREIRAWAITIPEVEVTAEVADDRVVVRAAGPPALARQVAAEARQVRERAMDAWLTEHGFRRGRTGGVTFDHAPLVAAYADEVAPVATALAGIATGPRDYAELALSFVQSIPYEAPRGDREVGYHRPLALLARNHGDCDSKVVLYLALLRAAYPTLPLAVVYVPGHALAGVGLPRRDGDWSLTHRGASYLFAEPVGPARLALGAPGPESRAGGQAEVSPVPTR